MFLRTFNISDWDVSSVTSMEKMFQNAFDDIPFVVNWNAESLEIATRMFDSSNVNNVNLSNFKTTDNLKSISQMFTGCSNLQEVNVSGLNTKNIGTWYGLFNNCTSLRTLDLSSLNTSSCLDIRNIFKGCNNIYIDLSCFFAYKVPTGKTFLYEDAFPETEGVTLKIPNSLLDLVRFNVDMSRYKIINVNDDDY